MSNYSFFKTPEKTTVKNNHVISIRSPEFPLPSVTRKQKISSESCFAIDNPLESLTNRDENGKAPLINVINIRRRLNRDDENTDQREARLAYQKQRSALNRLRESEDERIARLMGQRKRWIKSKANAKQTKKTVCLKSTQRHRVITGAANKKENMLEKNQQNLLEQYKWPDAIPTKLKKHCLQDFCHQMSMPILRQCVCMICNIRASGSTMKEFSLDDIPNSDKLSCHMDLLNVIKKISDISESKNIYKMITLTDS